MECMEKDDSHSSGSSGNRVHSLISLFSGALEGISQGHTDMDGVAGRRTDNFIKWCHRCKHEVPEWVRIDRCDLCGGEIIKISNESEDKQ